MTNIVREDHGYFAKGHSANPGGRLGRGQKIVRSFAIENLHDILSRLKGIYTNEEYPTELRVKIMLNFISRAAGKIEEPPVRDEDEQDITQMSGAQVVSALTFAMKQKEEAEKKTNS